MIPCATTRWRFSHSTNTLWAALWKQTLHKCCPALNLLSQLMTLSHETHYRSSKRLWKYDIISGHFYLMPHHHHPNHIFFPGASGCCLVLVRKFETTTCTSLIWWDTFLASQRSRDMTASGLTLITVPQAQYYMLISYIQTHLNHHSVASFRNT